MKSALYLTFILIVFSFFSCSEEAVEYEQLPVNRIRTEVLGGDSVEPEINSFDSLRSSKIDVFFKGKLKRRLFNGTVLFAEHGRIIHSAAYGFKDVRKKNALDEHSVFQLASVSKPFTAYAVLLLWQNKALDIEDDITKYLPDFPYENIKIRNLLTHRGGLTNYMYFTDKHWPDWDVPISNDDVLALFNKHRPDVYYSPDRRYNYSNTGYIILASIIERVSGKSFESYMKEAVFLPLGMKNSYIYKATIHNRLNEEVVGHMANGRRAENTYLNGTVGDKGLHSTVHDMFLFDENLRKGTLVHKDILEKAYKAQHRDLHKDDNYGFGWRINDQWNGSDKLVYHRGWWKGFRTYFLRDIKEERTIILLNNTIRGSFLKNEQLFRFFEVEESV